MQNCNFGQVKKGVCILSSAIMSGPGQGVADRRVGQMTSKVEPGP